MDHQEVDSSDGVKNRDAAADKEKKRSRHDEKPTYDDDENGKKLVRFDAFRDTTHAIPPRQKLSGDELLAEAELQACEQPSQKLLELSPRGIQSAAQSLERTLQRNQLLRAQHQDDPSKFMMNELALNDEIVSFQSAAVNVLSYESLIEFGVIQSFLILLNHENSDISISVINVLVELLDPTLLQEDKEESLEKASTEINSLKRVHSIGLLANAFVEGSGLELITSNLGRFDETVEEEAKGIEDVLTLAESLIDFDQKGVLQKEMSSAIMKEMSENKCDRKNLSIVASLCNQTTFVSWLFNRIEKRDDTDSTASAPISSAVIKLHSSEVLSAILQHEDYSMRRCGNKLASLPKYVSAFDDLDEKIASKKSEYMDGENKVDIRGENVDGMEILLQSIATFRKSDPQVEVECEFLENVFDSLAASLLREDNVVDFVEYQGIELMLRCLREKVHAGGGALKVLNFALSGSSLDASTERPGDGNVNLKACGTFIHVGGLKVLFPIYMARKSAIPCPASCSEGGSNLAKKIMGHHVSNDNKDKKGEPISKRAKRAAHARKKWLMEVEQNAINILYSLTRHIHKDSQFDAHARLLVKFVEEDCVSCSLTFSWISTM